MKPILLHLTNASTNKNEEYSNTLIKAVAVCWSCKTADYFHFLFTHYLVKKLQEK